MLWVPGDLPQKAIPGRRLIIKTKLAEHVLGLVVKTSKPMPHDQSTWVQYPVPAAGCGFLQMQTLGEAQ